MNIDDIIRLSETMEEIYSEVKAEEIKCNK